MSRHPQTSITSNLHTAHFTQLKLLFFEHLTIYSTLRTSVNRHCLSLYISVPLLTLSITQLYFLDFPLALACTAPHLLGSHPTSQIVLKLFVWALFHPILPAVLLVCHKAQSSDLFYFLFISPPSGKLFLILAWLISSMLMTPNFTSVSRGIM